MVKMFPKREKVEPLILGPSCFQEAYFYLCTPSIFGQYTVVTTVAVFYRLDNYFH